MRGKKMLKILLMLAGIFIFIIVMYFAVNLWRWCTFRIGKTLYIDVVDADAEYLEYIYSMRNNRSHGDPNTKLNLLDKKVLVKLIKYMKKNDLKIRDGEYAIPQTSTFKELLEILDFEENKNLNDPIP